METSQLVLNSPYLILKIEAQRNATPGGIIVEENTDDFLLVGEVVKAHPASLYKVASKVLFHILNAESFRHGADDFYLLDESFVKGIYGQ